MLIKFKNHPRVIWMSIISGLIFIAMATFMKIMTEGINAAIIIAYVLAACCLVLAIHMRYHGYLKIVDDWIYRYSIIRKSVNLTEVWDVRKNVYGHYVLYTDYGKLEINPRQLSKKSFKELKEVMRKYKLELD